LARARNIKPGFFLNDVLAEIEPIGRLLFIGLWTIADREGRLEDRCKKIKAAVLPYENCNVHNLLNALQNKGFIMRYEVDGRGYIQIVNFLKHQNPHMKEQASEIPAPDLHGACMVQIPDEHGSCPADSLNPHPSSPFPLIDIKDDHNNDTRARDIQKVRQEIPVNEDGHIGDVFVQVPGGPNVFRQYQESIKDQLKPKAKETGEG